MADSQGRHQCLNRASDKIEIYRHLIIDQIRGLGPSKIIKTATKLGCNLNEISQQPTQVLSSIGWSQEQIESLSAPLIRELQITKWLDASEQHHIVCFDHDIYPSLLKQISQPPLALFCVGDLALLSKPALAVVGSRRVSRDAELNTLSIVKGVCEATDLVIVSGLALGVDGLAHRQALASNAKTIAVLGNGVDIVYPKRHAVLYQQIAQNGLLISEFLPSVSPKPDFFPRRNRIISGLSLATLITEARIKSGSLVTANYALEQNRDVFAMPGNVRNPNSQGCHWLIKQGATLTESALDIIQVIGDKYRKSPSDNELSNSAVTQKNKQNTNQSLASDPLLDNVGYESTPVDFIAQQTGMSISEVLVQLLEYELRGLVASTSEGYIKLGS